MTRARYNRSDFSTSLLKKVFSDLFYNRVPTDKNVTLHVFIPEKDAEKFEENPFKYLFDPLNITNEDSVK